MRDIYIKDQQRKLTAGQINRRQFMVSVLATGIAASTALSLASEAEASTPKKVEHSDMAWVMVQPQTRLTLELLKTTLP